MFYGVGVLSGHLQLVSFNVALFSFWFNVVSLDIELIYCQSFVSNFPNNSIQSLCYYVDVDLKYTPSRNQLLNFLPVSSWREMFVIESFA